MRSSTFVTPQMKLAPLKGEQSPSGSLCITCFSSLCRRAFQKKMNGLSTDGRHIRDVRLRRHSWAVRVRSSCSLCVAACTELNQLQRQALSFTLEQLRSLSIACEAFMVLINKRPKCLR